MARPASCVLAFITLTCVAAPDARAQCFAPHPFSGKNIEVKEQAGQTYDAYALASWLPYGPPTIYYGKRFYEQPALMQAFIQRHECAHLSVPTNDEVEANCVALKQLRSGGLAADDESKIAAWIVAEGAQGFLYKGSGEEYWAATLKCAGASK